MKIKAKRDQEEKEDLEKQKLVILDNQDEKKLISKDEDALI